MTPPEDDVHGQQTSHNKDEFDNNIELVLNDVNLLQVPARKDKGNAPKRKPDVVGWGRVAAERVGRGMVGGGRVGSSGERMLDGRVFNGGKTRRMRMDSKRGCWVIA